MSRQTRGESGPRVKIRDIVAEAAVSVTQRPARTILTAMGTVLGVAMFVATLGISGTAVHQVSDRFDALRATEVVVQDLQPESGSPGFPDNAGALLTDLNGVRHAGTMWFLDEQSIGATLASSTRQTLPVIGATPGALQAMGPVLATGRLYDEFHESTQQQVALLGPGAARRLGILRIDNRPAVFVGDIAFTVVGIIEDFQRRPEALAAVIVPSSLADVVTEGLAAPTVEAYIETEQGAAQLIAQQAPYVLSPTDPDRLLALAPPNPSDLRLNVEDDLNALFLLLASVSLILGAFGIANSSLVAVIQRVPEIGLRRALGARPRHVAAQLVTESALVGLLAGVLGASCGVLITVGVAAWRQWTPILAPILVAAGPPLGALTGLIAGLIPAYRASRIEPVDALRR